MSLEKLLNHLIAEEQLNITIQDIYGHKDFGKENCPGIAITRFLDEYKN